MRTAPQPNKKKPSGKTVRINKRMADLGLTSRREADELITAGKVFVNGTKATPGMQVSETDKIDLRANTKQGNVYYAYNKPMGILTTGAQQDEKDILMHTKFKKPVFPVGRLDKDSHGLLIMTNDRRITHRLLDPQFEHEKEYRVTVRKPLNHAFARELELGVKIDGVRTKPVKIMRESSHTFRIILKEGRNRQIRRMVEAAGDHVVDLLRIRVEHIKLGDLPEGAFRSLTTKETKDLLTKLGLK